MPTVQPYSSTAPVKALAGTAAEPSITFTGNTGSGLYSPGANQVAIATGGVQRLLIGADGSITPASPLRFPLGTASSPSISFTGDTNTGIYSPGADQVAVATNGAQRIEIQADGDVSIDSGTVFVDAGSNRLGVNTSNPAYELEVSSTGEADIQIDSGSGQDGALRFAENGTNAFAIFHDASASALAVYDNTALSQRLTIDSSGNVGVGTSSPDRLLHLSAADTAYLRLENQDTTGSVDQYVGLIEFEGQDTGGSGVRAQIGAIYEGVSGATAVTIGTSADAGSVTERVRINRNGNVGIGVTNPTRLFHANDSANEIVARFSSGQSSSWAQFAASGNGTASRVGSPDGSATASLAFMTNDAERARIDSSGRLLVGTSSDSTGGLLQVRTSSTSNRNLSLRSDQASLGYPFIQYFDRSANNAAVSNNESLGTILFRGHDGSALISSARITAEVDGTPGTDDMPGRLVFSTTADGASSPTEQLRITSDRYVRLASGTGGIQFNGDTAAANALDDYEEGTWTPAYQTSNSDISITSTTVSHAVYTKIGNRVFCTCRFFSNVASVGTGTVRVTGLPFTSASSQGNVSCVISFAARFSTAAPVTATVRSSATQLDLITVYTDATLGGDVTYMPAANLRAATANSNIISISFNYIV